MLRYGNKLEMEYSAYALLGVERNAEPQAIMQKCKDYIQRWNQTDIEHDMRKQMTPEQSAVCAAQVFDHGMGYLRAVASMLLDPSARQCYDAWLDVTKMYTPEKAALTRARLTWFNSTGSNINFSQDMINNIHGVEMSLKDVTSKRELSVKPVCRQCKGHFSFNDDYLVLHCDCTTRVGHPRCLNNFASSQSNKCPVCRKKLLVRHKVSKYLFWNVKEKFKFVS